MDPLKLFIDRSTGRVRRSNTDTEPPKLQALKGTTLKLAIAFLDDESMPVAVDVSESYLVVKKPFDHVGEALLLDASWEVSGSGAATRYTFETLVDSVQLRQILLDQDSVPLRAQIQWTPTGETAPRRSLPFQLTVVNSYIQDDEPAPDPAADAAFAWLVARLLAGAGISLTPDEGAKTITIAGAASASPVDLILAASDESTDLTVGDGKIQFLLPRALEITEVYASLNDAPTGSSLLVDIESYDVGAETWSSILSAPIEIPFSATISAAASLAVTTFAKHDRLRVNIDQVGSANKGVGLKIMISGNPV